MRYILVALYAVGVFYLFPEQSVSQRALTTTLSSEPIEMKVLQPEGVAREAIVPMGDTTAAPALAQAAFQF